MIKTLARNFAKTAGKPAVHGVAVDYPLDGEVLTHPAYTVRVGAAPEASSVEVSINDGQWRPCRESMGLWWYDWSDVSDGDMTLRARIHTAGGAVAESPVRRFKVRLQP